jgi:hypothetical protein
MIFSKVALSTHEAIHLPAQTPNGTTGASHKTYHSS